MVRARVIFVDFVLKSAILLFNVHLFPDRHGVLEKRRDGARGLLVVPCAVIVLRERIARRWEEGNELS